MNDSTDAPRDSFDIAWKTLLEDMFPDFLWFFFPHLADEIDLRLPDVSPGEERPAPWVFLNQGLPKIHPEAETGSRAVDKLLRIRTRHDGCPRYVHVEVQSQPDQTFAERMYTYWYRIRDRFRGPVTCLAVLGDDSPGWRPNSFRLSALATTLDFSWSTVKLLDYQGCEDELCASEQPFAWITLAHLATLQTRRQAAQRFNAKQRLIRLAVSKGWGRQRIISLVKALDFMMRLPEDMNRRLWQELLDEGKVTMELMCDWERSWLEQGREEGRKAEAALIRQMLTRRFGPLPEDIANKVKAGTFSELERWGTRLLDAASLDAIFVEED